MNPHTPYGIQDFKSCASACSATRPARLQSTLCPGARQRPSAWRMMVSSTDFTDLRDLVLYLARHECGTKICREKGIEYARRLLGHANISTTQRYMHLDDRELAEAQDLVE